MPMRIDVSSVEVLVDGGSRPGRIVTADGKLAAILVHVSAADQGRPSARAGWYLEAGFGRCSALLTRSPEPFASERDALLWVSAQVD